MRLKQIRLAKIANFCYLIGDEGSETCALIDAAFETDRILAEVDDLGYETTHIINTHEHSDHTAGNEAIKAATGAKLLIHAEDAGRLGKVLHSTFSRLLGGKGSPHADVLLQDRDVIQIGEVRLKVIHTPGNTPGGICLYREGHIFTGDTLFLGAVGRTDLPAGSIKQLVTSTHEKICTLLDNTVVWPGHDYGTTSSSTVQQEKDTNP